MLPRMSESEQFNISLETNGTQAQIPLHGFENSRQRRNPVEATELAAQR